MTGKLKAKRALWGLALFLSFLAGWHAAPVTTGPAPSGAPLEPAAAPGEGVPRRSGTIDDDPVIDGLRRLLSEPRGGGLLSRAREEAAFVGSLSAAELGRALGFFADIDYGSDHPGPSSRLKQLVHTRFAERFPEEFLSWAKEAKEKAGVGVSGYYLGIALGSLSREDSSAAVGFYRKILDRGQKDAATAPLMEELLQSGRLQEAWEVAQSAPGDRHAKLRFVEQISPENAPGVLQFLKENATQPDDRHLLTRALTTLVRLNSDAAIKHAMDFAQGDDDALVAVVRNMVVLRPVTEVLATIESRGLGKRLGQSILPDLMKKAWREDPAETLRWVVESEDNPELIRAKYALARMILPESPEAAASIIDALPGSRVRDQFYLEAAIDQTFKDPRTGALWAAAMENPRIKTEALGIALHVWGSSGAPGAIDAAEYVLESADPTARRENLLSVFRGFGQREVPPDEIRQVKDWIDGLEDGEKADLLETLRTEAGGGGGGTVYAELLGEGPG